MRNIPKGVLLLTLMIFAGFANAKVDPELLEWATQGDANSQYNLALMYGNGRGVPEDDKEAVKWYRLAADQGIASAQYNLGFMYAFGEGVPEDKVQAFTWASLAGANGYDVSKLKEVLKEILSQQDMSEAQSLTRQLKKDFPDIY